VSFFAFWEEHHWPINQTVCTFSFSRGGLIFNSSPYSTNWKVEAPCQPLSRICISSHPPEASPPWFSHDHGWLTKNLQSLVYLSILIKEKTEMKFGIVIWELYKTSFCGSSSTSYRKIILGQDLKPNRKIILGQREYYIFVYIESFYSFHLDKWCESYRQSFFGAI